MKRVKARKRYRSAKDGQFVTKEEAEASPDTTIAETRDDAARFVIEGDADDPTDTHEDI